MYTYVAIPYFVKGNYFEILHSQLRGDVSLVSGTALQLDPVTMLFNLTL